jgi:hypothetical protein
MLRRRASCFTAYMPAWGVYRVKDFFDHMQVRIIMWRRGLK